MKDKKTGEVIEECDLRVIRSGFGIKPKYLEKIIGKNLAMMLQNIPQ